jgi:hypothetical protein
VFQSREDKFLILDPQDFQDQEAKWFDKKMSVSNQDSGRRFIPPPIALERPANKDLKKNECLLLKLRSDPTNVDSQTYELTIKFFNTSTPEEWLIFLRDLKRVLVVRTSPMAQESI